MTIFRKNSMRRPCAGLLGFLAALGLFAPGSTVAQQITRVDATRLSCQALQDIINDRGAVIVRSRSLFSNNQLSERYVSGRRFCFNNEVVRFRSVATADRDKCPVNLCTLQPNRSLGR